MISFEAAVPEVVALPDGVVKEQPPSPVHADRTARSFISMTTGFMENIKNVDVVVHVNDVSCQRSS